MSFKSKKFVEFICFLLIICAFVVIGYYTYESYANKKKDNTIETKVDNYYNIEYLFNNSYVKTSEEITNFKDEKNDVYMYLDKNNTLYVKYTNKNNIYNKHITGLPSGNITVYYNNLNDNIYELSALTKKGDLYYAYINIANKKDYKFEKIASNIDSVYSPIYDKKYVYIRKSNGFKTNFIYLDNNNKLKYINKEDDYELLDNLKDVKPYFDYVCIGNKLCDKVMIYQNFEKKLVASYNDKIIKNDKNEDITVKEMFGVLEVKKNKKVDFTKLTYKKLKKYDYLFKVYIVDKNDKIYTLDINNNLIKTKEENKALPLSIKKVKQLKYEGDISKVDIIYTDGSSEKVEQGNNKIIISSTVYDKDKNLELKVK